MKKTIGWAVSLLLTGLTLHCGSSTTMATDMATTVDQATAAVDMATKPADMATTPADMVTPVFNGCTSAMFMDQSAQAASRAVAFANGNNTYSPKCILINAGQAVTFNGNFSGHPLRPGVGATATAGSPNNPIPANTNTGNTLAVTFPTAGDYPYNCSAHDSLGMNGVVRVK